MDTAHWFLLLFDVAFVVSVLGSLAHMKAQLARDREADRVFFTQMVRELHP